MSLVDDTSFISSSLKNIENLEKENEKHKTEFETMVNNYTKLFESVKNEISNLKKNYDEFEKDKMMINTLHFEEVIQLNVGGHRHFSSLKTLQKHQDSLLAKMFSGKFTVKPGNDGSYFVDRDGRNFYLILNYLRDDNITLPKNDQILIDELLKEAESYQLNGLVEHLKLCKTKNEEETKNDSLKKEKEFEERLKTYKTEVETKFTLFQKECNEKLDVLKMDSVLITNDEKKLLLQWIPDNLKNKKLVLIFRASRDGYTAQEFHNKCDTKAPTIVIIHSNHDHVFGGFTPISWDSTSNYKAEDTKSSFLFLLRSQKGDALSKFGLKASDTTNHIHCSAANGPTFGSGHDINIVDNCNTNNGSCSNFGTSYDHQNDQNKLAGAYNFTVKDYEVFVVE